MTPDQFKLDISKWVEKVQKNAEQLVRAVAIQVLTSVVEKSPVGNPDTWKYPAPPGYVGGRFRANWRVSVGKPSMPTVEGSWRIGSTNIIDAVDPSGQRTIAAGTAALAAVGVTQPIYIYNNLPYAYRLEFEGWSKQAPAGMVRVTVAEFSAIVDDEVRKLNQQTR